MPDGRQIAGLALAESTRRALRMQIARSENAHGARYEISKLCGFGLCFLVDYVAD